VNKIVLPAIILGIVLVAGIFAFMPVQKVSTVHDFLIASILGEPGVTNQEIAEELKDKLKMMVATDEEDLAVGDDFGTGQVSGYYILVEALDENGDNVIFNLKEVYLCGSAEGEICTLEVDAVHIQNIILDEIDKDIISIPDITITNAFGVDINEPLLTDTGCVDVISELADSGRAGEVGLGSDERLAIEIGGLPGDSVDFVKCIAFTPNSAEELICDIQPFSEETQE